MGIGLHRWQIFRIKIIDVQLQLFNFFLTRSLYNNVQ